MKPKRFVLLRVTRRGREDVRLVTSSGNEEEVAVVVGVDAVSGDDVFKLLDDDVVSAAVYELVGSGRALPLEVWRARKARRAQKER